jgi:hypothetical protein
MSPCQALDKSRGHKDILENDVRVCVCVRTQQQFKAVRGREVVSPVKLASGVHQLQCVTN